MEDNVHPEHNLDSLVSIPLWDDWKNLPSAMSGISKMFQFHYGMIGREELDSILVDITLFQFHYGMIGRLAVMSVSSLSPMFQFHYGMIGRKRWLKGKRFGESFNSTMG